ncbi:MAG: hypothetical protein ABW000_13965 [Actinoplanes sp.]
MIVDVHTHYLPTSFRPMLATLTAMSGARTAGAASPPPEGRQILAAISDEPGMIDQRIDMMDDAGVERQILSSGSLAPYATDSRVAVEAALWCACEAFGADHLVPGSDFSALLAVESYHRMSR